MPSETNSCSESGEMAGQWVPVPWNLRDVVAAPRRAVVDGRPVALFSHKGRLFALDANCYHAGGALEKCRDIEDIGAQPCIRCPLHKYVISISTGEAFYRPVTFEKEEGGALVPIPGDWASKGVKQRTHRVRVREPGGGISVQLSTSSSSSTTAADAHIPSDDYVRCTPLGPNN
eukprot:GHVU01090846.1.p1 GENE.GHVU01090846.1~~GHVU01090846.1.p1  ORF type:complete len:174 (+),score=26.89 GHVU01090846.1:690-1211(+)